MSEARYPTQDAMFRGRALEADQRFEELREDFLLNYGYQTARAYWSDLDDLHRWAVERGKAVLQLSRDDIRAYLAMLRRRGYCKSTMRRRLTAFRAFFGALHVAGGRGDVPTDGLVVRSSSRVSRRYTP